jgi:hypothetical protein
MVVARVFFRRKVAIPHLDALKNEAGRQADNFGLTEQERWWGYHGDEISFAFAKGDQEGRDAAVRFANCSPVPWSRVRLPS